MPMEVHVICPSYPACAAGYSPFVQWPSDERDHRVMPIRYAEIARAITRIGMEYHRGRRARGER
jgi:hypothetical protein